MNDLSIFNKIKGNYIHPTAIVNWNKVKMGKNNIVYPYSCIGLDAQHPREVSNGIVEIGNNNIFREFSTVHLPTSDKKLTKIGNNCYFMILCHIAHDCKIEDYVRISNNSILAGNVHVMKNAVIGLSCCIHQSQVIGSYTMLGMGTIVGAKSKILPGKIFVGKSAKGLKDNIVGLQRNKVTSEHLLGEIKRFHILYNEIVNCNV